MKKMNLPSILTLLLAGCALHGTAQIRPINIPDIDGYLTLVSDLHTHTIYSDGSVMPSVRVGEALREGLDVIAVTEHIEDYCRKIPETKWVDLNTSYNLYKESAEGSDLIVIRGGEISRGMPPGHLNCLFLQDVNPLDTEHTDEGIWKAVEIAIDQGAFVVWNHPNWKYQQPDTTLWWNFHTELYEKGWLHGIEIANHTDPYCPEALEWYRQYNLAPMAGSDTHSPTFYEYDLVNSHRPVTLIFSEERSLESVKDALFARRTIAYNNEMLWGNPDLLQAVFQASVSAKLTKTKSGAMWSLTNNSDVPYQLRLQGEPQSGIPSEFVIAPNGTTDITLKGKNVASRTLDFDCLNLQPADNEYITVAFDLSNL